MKKERSKISWTDFTFNPWIGCTKVSPGCRLCYAEAQDHRWGHDSWGKGKPRRRTTEAYWRSPYAWDKEAAALGKRFKVFCASLADWADNEVPDEWRHDLFLMIERTPHLDWLLLTKRPDEAYRYHRGYRFETFKNIWMGITVVNESEVQDKLWYLMHLPAPVKWISAEPLLGALHLESYMVPFGVDWVVVGGESGPKFSEGAAAPFHPDWARDLRDQCHRHGKAFFMKQMGSRPVTMNLPGKGDDPALWPKDLQVQEFPNGEVIHV